MSGIVKRLGDWAHVNAPLLRQKGFLVEENIPMPDSNIAWKASIGLVYNDIIATYTVWERDVLQTELIVMNAKTAQTLVMNDATVDNPDVVDRDLRDVVDRLIDNSYSNMKPDPKLVIT